MFCGNICAWFQLTFQSRGMKPLADKSRPSKTQLYHLLGLVFMVMFFFSFNGLCHGKSPSFSIMSEDVFFAPQKNKEISQIQAPDFQSLGESYQEMSSTKTPTRAFRTQHVQWIDMWRFACPHVKHLGIDIGWWHHYFQICNLVHMVHGRLYARQSRYI